MRRLNGVFRFFNIDAHCDILRGSDVAECPPNIIIKGGRPCERKKPEVRFRDFLKELASKFHLIAYKPLFEDGPYPSGPGVCYLYMITEINVSGIDHLLAARISEITELLRNSLRAYGLTEVYCIPDYTENDPPAAFKMEPCPDQTASSSEQNLTSCRRMLSLLMEIGVTSSKQIGVTSRKKSERAFWALPTIEIEIEHRLLHIYLKKKIIKIPDNDGGLFPIQRSGFNSLTWCYISSCLSRCPRGQALLTRISLLDRLENKHKSLFLELNSPDFLPEYTDPVLGKLIAKIPVCVQGLSTVLYELETLIGHSSTSDHGEECSSHVIPQAKRCAIMPAPRGYRRLEKNIVSLIKEEKNESAFWLPRLLPTPSAVLPVSPSHSLARSDISSAPGPSSRYRPY